MIGVPLALAVPGAVLALIGLAQVVVAARLMPGMVRQELRRRKNAAEWARRAAQAGNHGAQ